MTVPEKVTWQSPFDDDPGPARPIPIQTSSPVGSPGRSPGRSTLPSYEGGYETGRTPVGSYGTHAFLLQSTGSWRPLSAAPFAPAKVRACRRDPLFFGSWAGDWALVEGVKPR